MAISGNITHDFYVSIPVFSGQEDFTNLTKKVFRNICVYGEEGDDREYCFTHAKIVAQFLHSSKMVFNCKRCMVYDYQPVWAENSPLKEFRMMLSCFWEDGIIRISFHTSFAEADADYIIAERQSGAHRRYRFADGQERTFAEIKEEVLRKLTREYHQFEETFLVEINEWDTYSTDCIDPVTAVREREAKIMYGFLSGDEGWEYVPDTTVNARLEDSWSSRDFMRLYSFGPSFLLLNFNKGICHEKYMVRQTQFGTATYGGVNDYFLLPDCPLSVNHGIMHACEHVLVIKSIVDRVYHYHTSLRSNTRVAGNIRMSKKYRSEILGALNKIERVQISEIGELEQNIMRSQNISPVVEKVKSLLELLESELDLAYSTHTNLMVNILTVAGLLLTILGIALPYLI